MLQTGSWDCQDRSLVALLETSLTERCMVWESLAAVGMLEAGLQLRRTCLRQRHRRQVFMSPEKKIPCFLGTTWSLRLPSNSKSLPSWPSRNENRLQYVRCIHAGDVISLLSACAVPPKVLRRRRRNGGGLGLVLRTGSLSHNGRRIGYWLRDGDRPRRRLLRCFRIGKFERRLPL